MDHTASKGRTHATESTGSAQPLRHRDPAALTGSGSYLDRSFVAHWWHWQMYASHTGLDGIDHPDVSRDVTCGRQLSLISEARGDSWGITLALDLGRARG
jgi:hypothetical protein